MIGTQFRRLIYVFEVQLSNRTIKNIARSNRKWEFQDGGLQTRSMHISPCKYDRKSNGSIPMFSESDYTERLVEILSDVGVICKSKMAAINRK